jgi:hypothetical protein
MHFIVHSGTNNRSISSWVQTVKLGVNYAYFMFLLVSVVLNTSVLSDMQVVAKADKLLRVEARDS